MKTPEGLLVLSRPDDLHFQVVHHALSSIGVSVQLLTIGNFPRWDSHTASVSEDGVTYRIRRHDGLVISPQDYELVWNRRAVYPVVCPDLSPADLTAAYNEAEMFVEGMKSVCCDRQLWINDPTVEGKSGNKPLQLYVAQKAGLLVPRTVMSNWARDLADFASIVGDRTILKTFYPITWTGEEAVHMAYAARITAGSLRENPAARLTANLVQEYIDKSYELRVIYIDGYIIPVKIYSQQIASARVDWRASLKGNPHVEIAGELPESVLVGIRNYACEMGLWYGAFDFAVDVDGRHFFLECNPSGQFLFLEEWNPAVPVMAQFLAALGRNLRLDDAQLAELCSFRLADFHADRRATQYYADMVRSWPSPAEKGFVYADA